MATLVIVSLLTSPPPAEKVEGYIWTRQVFTRETAALKALPWYKNYRIQSLVLLILTAIFVMMFA
ncbi:MAG: hypothetical protein D6814_02050 [Calditrichaeota bacterium]|nr:MAG: hypothetical protein D6814_02050 [Calditrichota bacterium]